MVTILLERVVDAWYAAHTRFPFAGEQNGNGNRGEKKGNVKLIARNALVQKDLCVRRDSVQFVVSHQLPGISHRKSVRRDSREKLKLRLRVCVCVCSSPDVP